MNRTLTLWTCALWASAAGAQPLIFDDLPVDQHVGEGYAALGIHFALTDFGVVSGLSNGDPGNWGLEGTNGSNFMGFNGSPSYDMELLFDGSVVGFSMDVSRSNGSNQGDGLSVQYWRDGGQVGSDDITFGEINSWSTVGTDSAIDRVTFQGSGADFHPYGVDNMNFASEGGCYADFTEDGVLDLFDFLAFVNAFNAGDDAADCDGEGGLDLFDFLCFTNAFNAGC